MSFQLKSQRSVFFLLFLEGNLVLFNFIVPLKVQFGDFHHSLGVMLTPITKYNYIKRDVITFVFRLRLALTEKR